MKTSTKYCLSGLVVVAIVSMVIWAGAAMLTLHSAVVCSQQIAEKNQLQKDIIQYRQVIYAMSWELKEGQCFEREILDNILKVWQEGDKAVINGQIYVITPAGEITIHEN